MQFIFHLIPERGLTQTAFDNFFPVPIACSRTVSVFRPAATLSNTDIVRNGAGFWNTMPILAPDDHRVGRLWHKYLCRPA